MTIEQFDALGVGSAVRDKAGRVMKVVFKTKFGIGCMYDGDNFVHTFARYSDVRKELSN